MIVLLALFGCFPCEAVCEEPEPMPLGTFGVDEVTRGDVLDAEVVVDGDGIVTIEYTDPDGQRWRVVYERGD